MKVKKINSNISEVRNFQASISKSLLKLNWKPKTNFNYGLNNLVNYVFSKKIKNIKFNKVSEKNGELIFIESKKIFKNGFKGFFSFC